jgi:hypothetical protein
MSNGLKLTLFCVLSAICLLIGWPWPLELVSNQTAILWIRCWGYWMILGCFLLWLVSLIRAYPALLKKEGYLWLWDRKYLLAALVILGAWLVMQLGEEKNFKILEDEPVLINTSRMMHFHREVYVVSNAKQVDGVYFTEGYVDKRPNFFPFLVCTLHDLTGYRVENAFYLNSFLTLAMFVLAWVVASKIAGQAAGLVSVGLLASIPLIWHQSSGAGFEILNLVMILLTIKVAMDYLERPTSRMLSALWLTAIMLSQVRYESALFLIPVGIVALMGWSLSDKKPSPENTNAGLKIFLGIGTIPALVFAFACLAAISRISFTPMIFMETIVSWLTLHNLLWILFLVPIPPIILSCMAISKKAIIPWGMWVVPVLLIPVIWQQRAFLVDKDFWELFSVGLSQPFSLDYYDNGFMQTLHFFFAWIRQFPNAPLVSFLGILSVIVFGILATIRTVPRWSMWLFSTLFLALSIRCAGFLTVCLCISDHTACFHGLWYVTLAQTLLILILFGVLGRAIWRILTTTPNVPKWAAWVFMPFFALLALICSSMPYYWSQYGGDPKMTPWYLALSLTGLMISIGLLRTPRLAYEDEERPTLVFWTFLVGFGLYFLLLMCYAFDMSHYMVVRLTLPLYLLFALTSGIVWTRWVRGGILGYALFFLMAVWFYFGWLQGFLYNPEKGWNLSHILICLAILAVLSFVYFAYVKERVYYALLGTTIAIGFVGHTIPCASSREYAGFYYPMVEAKFAKLFMDEHKDERYMIIAEMPMLWTVYGIEALPTRAINNELPATKYFIGAPNNPPVYLMQSLEYEPATHRYKDLSSDQMNPNAILEPIKEYSIGTFRRLRFSRLMDIKNVEPFDDKDLFHGEEGDRFNDWINHLP